MSHLSHSRTKCAQNNDLCSPSMQSTTHSQISFRTPSSSLPSQSFEVALKHLSSSSLSFSICQACLPKTSATARETDGGGGGGGRDVLEELDALDAFVFRSFDRTV